MSSGGVNAKKQPTVVPSGVFDSVYKKEVKANGNGAPSQPFDEPVQRPQQTPADTEDSPHEDSDNKTTYDSNSELAAMLIECANYVAKGEFNPIIYQALGALHVYTGEKTNAAGGKSATTGGLSSGPSFDANPPSSTDYATGGANGKPRASSNVAKFRQMHSSSRSVSGAGNDDKNKFRDTTKVAAKVLGSKFGALGKDAKKMWNTHTKHDPLTRRHTSALEEGNDDLRVNSSVGDDASISGSVHGQSSPTNSEQSSAAPKQNTPGKPSFQRPINPNSNLIANGWIEQQRRSKMRVVWKEVLASLVSARKAGEETTLWIQRQVISPTGRAELEALHQVPMKWLEDVTYLEFNGEHRFTLKVFNITEEFQFRCIDNESAQNWILTLRSARDSSKQVSLGSSGPRGNFDGDEKPDGLLRTSSRHMRSGSNTRQASVRNTERGSSTPTNRRKGTSTTPVRQRSDVKLSIKELKAIAREAGIDTSGMERADLEKIAAKQRPKSTSPKPRGQLPSIPPPPPPTPQSKILGDKNGREQSASRRREDDEQDDLLKRQEEQWRKMEMQAERKQKEQEEALEQQRQHEESERVKAELEERRRQEQAHAIAQERMRQQQEAAAAAQQMQMEQAAAQERMRQQQEYAMEQERMRQQQEHAMAQERMRQQQEQAAVMRQQQEQAAAQERLRQQQQEQWRQQQEWQKQQWQSQQQTQQQYYQQQQQQQQQQPHQQAPPQPQQQYYPNGAQSAAPPPQQQPNPQGANPTQLPSKYAKAMNEEDSGLAAITALKRNILLNWALLPPTLNALRPIHHLVCSIHSVFPPSFNVSGHAYFAKWKSISAADLQLSPAMNAPDEEKLKKAVRKIRFFLHPDKLPKDLDEQQQFMCKMLWDVTSDAWEEHKTKNEELDWVQP